MVLLAAACNSGSSPKVDAGGGPGADAMIDATACTDTSIDGCACAPVVSGAGGSITIDRPLIKLVADRARCVVYGLASNAVLVFDTRLKQQVAAIDLPTAATDLDVAGDGSRAVLGHRVAPQLTVLDLDQRAIADTIPTMLDTARVEITRDGVVFYADFDQFTEVHRVVLATRADTKLQEYVHYQADIELADDDIRLYVADSSLSSSAVAVYDTTDGVFGLIDHHTGSFVPPARHLVVSKLRHTYYAEHQWSLPDDLSFVTGGTREPIYAEDDMGRVAIGKQFVWDAALVRKIAPHAAEVSAAAFAAGGQEAWLYSAASNTIRYVATAELVGSHTLGLRDTAAGSLAGYSFDQLIHDPTRAMLYGRDRSRNVVVAIDTATLQATREVRVGSEPSDLAVDADGSTLYVAHEDMSAIARVSLATLSFDSFVPTVELPYEIEPVSPGRVVFNTRWGNTKPTLFDVASRTAYPMSSEHYYAAIKVVGSTLFVGETGSSGSHLYSYAIANTALTRTGQTTYNDGYGFNSPPRYLASTPTGSTVFYAGHALDGANLSTIRYAVGGHVRAVSPDGRVGLSSTHVYDVATGATLGALPFESNVQAISPASDAAFLINGATVTRLDLTTYQP